MALDKSCARVVFRLPKNKDTWCEILGNFWIPNKVQPRENSKGGGLEDISHNGSVWRNPNGNRNVVCLNENDVKRNANLNWFENDWGDDWRFAAVRNFLYFPAAVGGVFSDLEMTNPIHPPSIFPISSKYSERIIYFLLSIDLISQEIRRKNFSSSSLVLAFLKNGSFCSRVKWQAMKIFSVVSINN